ncbi:MAG: hypothetical protein U0R44_05895 [Candidatus Micrarchaeia archaeon]
MTEANRYKGFLSFDALASMLPVLVILLILADAASYLSSEARRSAERQALFDRLLSAADYTVRSGAVMRSGPVRYPNWIDEPLLDAAYVGALRASEGLSRLYVGLDPPGEKFGMCVYRLVVAGQSKTIRRLFVCGD